MHTFVNPVLPSEWQSARKGHVCHGLPPPPPLFPAIATVVAGNYTQLSCGHDTCTGGNLVATCRFQSWQTGHGIFVSIRSEVEAGGKVADYAQAEAFCCVLELDLSWFALRC